MSEYYLIKGETLTDMADALREKTGETGTFKTQDFATEIREIEAGGGDLDAFIDGTLTEVTSKVTSMRDYAFYRATMTTANFPNVTTISGNAFTQCSSLTTANFPNVTTVKSTSFYSCYKLTKVIIGTNTETVPTLSNTNAFQNCHHITGTVNATHNPEGLKDGFIYVKADKVAETRTKTNWVTYATQIMPWVATVEELANIDGTTYDHACVGEGVDSVEYYYNGTTWEVFR